MRKRRRIHNTTSTRKQLIFEEKSDKLRHKKQFQEKSMKSLLHHSFILES
jgi:hypothetical protein